MLTPEGNASTHLRGPRMASSSDESESSFEASASSSRFSSADSLSLVAVMRDHQVLKLSGLKQRSSSAGIEDGWMRAGLVSGFGVGDVRGKREESSCRRDDEGGAMMCRRSEDRVA